MNKSSVLHTQHNKYSEILSQSYVGEIVNIDKLQEGNGAIKIRVFGVFDSVDLGTIPDEDLPDAYPLLLPQFDSSGAGFWSSPKVGNKVRVVFMDNIYNPRYFGCENLSDKLRQLLEQESIVHSLMSDQDQKVEIYYTPKTGILMSNDSSLINIRRDNSILINHKDSQSTIELAGDTITLVSNSEIHATSSDEITLNSQSIHVNGNKTEIGANGIYSSVNGEQLINLLISLATALDAKLPITSGVNVALVNAMKEAILSNTVTVTP